MFAAAVIILWMGGNIIFDRCEEIYKSKKKKTYKIINGGRKLTGTDNKKSA